MLHHFVVPLDGSPWSERVLPPVTYLARRTGSAVTLVKVAGGREEASEGREYEGGERREARIYLEHICGGLRKAGVAADFEVLSGRPAEAVVHLARAQAAGLIAMSSHGRGGLARWFLGSVADEVVRVAATPVLLVGGSVSSAPAHAGELRTLLVPLDGSPGAEAALTVAAPLAEWLRAPLQVARVVQPSAEDQAAAEGYLAGVVEGLRVRGLTADPVLLTGDPGQCICGLASGMPTSLVVMSTRCRAGFGRWVLGSVAAEVVRDSGRPVLLARSGK